MKNDQIRTVIAGTGHYLPERVVTSEEVEEKMKSRLDFAFPQGSIEKLCGVKQRRYMIWLRKSLSERALVKN